MSCLPSWTKSKLNTVNMSAESQSYWKRHYVVESDADEIERHLHVTSFTSSGRNFKLVYFEKSKTSPNILISPGEAGHSYVFAEIGFRMQERGYNVFIMPKHGSSATINELVSRHRDALTHITDNFNDRIGVFAEGFGGYAAFYLALAHGPMKSAVYQNAPAILTEKDWFEAISGDTGAARRRKLILPIAKTLVKIFPNIKLPIWVYLDFSKMIDPNEGTRKIEESLVQKYLTDPDFDRWKTLSAAMSLVTTPPPNPLKELIMPTMFLVPTRGFTGPAYFRNLYQRLPPIKKKIIEVDGSVFWMVSHPKQAAKVICDWFDETV